MLTRNIELYQISNKKSFFLFGARSTGKSFWLKKTAPQNSLYLNLLDGDLYLRLTESTSILKQIISTEKKDIIVIDEIQRIPELLNEVHSAIEDNPSLRFILTGSSARKLKRSHANMLGGRASLIHFYPLSYSEIPEFDLVRYLTYGGLPRTYLSEDPLSELDSYLQTYIDQEVRLEANLRNLAPFHRFLKTAALSNGELLNYANIASDAGVPASTVKEYYSILEDSLIGYTLEPWVESKKRKAITTAKFYFFDPGVCNYITGAKSIERASDLWGKNFEQFILMELKSFLSYRQKRLKIYFWRSVNKQEVDFIIDDTVAIEVKSSKKTSRKHLAGLKALSEEKIISSYYLVSEDPINRTVEDQFQCLHWKTFLKRLWNNEIL